MLRSAHRRREHRANADATSHDRRTQKRRHDRSYKVLTDVYTLKCRPSEVPRSGGVAFATSPYEGSEGSGSLTAMAKRLSPSFASHVQNSVLSTRTSHCFKTAGFLHNHMAAIAVNRVSHGLDESGTAHSNLAMPPTANGSVACLRSRGLPAHMALDHRSQQLLVYMDSTGRAARLPCLTDPSQSLRSVEPSTTG